jgi:hypothetical protein
MAQKQIAPTTTIIKIPIKTEIMSPSLCCRSSFRFRLQSEPGQAADGMRGLSVQIACSASSLRARQWMLKEKEDGLGNGGTTRRVGIPS